MKWAEMSTEERNALIHEKVMGHSLTCHEPITTTQAGVVSLSYCPLHGLISVGDKPLATNGHAKNDPIPPYTTSMDAAWFVAEKFDEIVIERHVPGKYHCQLYRQGSMYHAIEATPQEAICVAALTIHGVEIE